MSKIEQEIRAEFARMNKALAVKGKNFTYGNTAEYWEGLSQYGFPMFYCETADQAEQCVIEFYRSHMFLIRQDT